MEHEMTDFSVGAPMTSQESEYRGYDHSLIIVVTGLWLSGQTNLLSRYVDGIYHTWTDATLGLDIRTKIITKDGLRIRLLLLGVKTEFEYILFRQADGIIFICDLTRTGGVGKIRQVTSAIKTLVEDDVPSVLVGTKCDKRNLVYVAEGCELAEELNIPFIEVSAKQGTNVVEAFDMLVTGILDRVP